MHFSLYVRQMALGLGMFFFALFLPVHSAMAMGNYCLCIDDLSQINPDNYEAMNNGLEALNKCTADIPAEKCVPENNDLLKKDGARFAACLTKFDNATACEDTYKQWVVNKEAKVAASKKAAQGLQSTKSSFLPDCALSDELTSECRDVSIFLILAINISRYVFSIIGGLSLLMFVYGGFTMIISQGNSEKIQQGKNIMVAVFIGLLIAFGGYILVSFLGQSLGLQQGFRLL